MEILGIFTSEAKIFYKMSGGERQMVLVARAMALQAQIMVMMNLLPILITVTR
jgi:ABC-type cobalamin/Fe3+-siderophores transport system ATPase subunit